MIRPPKSTKRSASSGSRLNLALGISASSTSRRIASPNKGVNGPNFQPTTVSSASVMKLDSVLASAGISQEQLYQECDDSDFYEIAEVVTNYRKYGSRLGLSSADITEQEKNSHISDSVELTTVAVFEKWHKRMGSMATYYELVQMFLKSRDRRAAEKVCWVLKAKEGL